MMSVPELESLFRKDKRSIAVALLKEYKNGDPGESKLIHKFMSEYLTVKKSLTDMDMIETIKWIISSGMTFDEYSKEVKKYDTATACGLVWIYNFIAYRCRTCAISPCMSLCADCFNKGDHEGHDFNMFKSLAGGACDCGDESVLKSSGFCSTHRQRPDTTLPVAPPKLLFLAKETVPYLLNRLLWELRQPKFEACIGADFFIDNVFNPLTEMGAQMRRLISEAMIDTSSYSSLAHDVDSDHLVIKNILNDRKKNYLAIKSRMQKTLRPELTFYKDQEFFANAMKRAFDKDLDHNCFVDELLFWTIYHEFPEKLVCFLLKMLPEANYRKRIAESFADHYSRLTSMLASCRGTDDENKQFYTDSLSSCVVHVSVQLFSNEPIALGLCENHHLLQIVVGSLRAIFEGHRNFDQDSTTVLLPSQLHTKSKENRHMVINCEHPIMKTHVFWPVVSDLTNLLVHTPIALMFMDSTELLDLWLQFMMHFQGMDVNTRELVNHVEFEGDSYHSAFAAEIEICATPLWTLISHLKDESTAELTRKMIKFSQKYLEEWFTLINFANSDVPDPLQATFHLPLHRYYSIFLHQGVQYQGLSLKELLPPPHLLKAYLAHPLQVQVDFYEIWAGLWVRNGHQMKAQAMTYVGCHYCNSMVDADLFLIQQIAANLDPDWFIQTVLERFHIWEWFSLDYNPSQASDSNSIAPDQTMSILEGALVFLATIFSVNTNLGASEKDVLRKEMVTLLAVGDRTHSQLTSFLPERCGTCHNIGLESILKDIADFREPTLESSGSLSQGMFFPKSKIWEEEYDPIYALLRAVHRRDFQFSLDRFTQHVRSTSKLENNSQALLWPPYRIPKNLDTSKFLDARKVLYSKVLHGAIFMILYKAVYSNNITEQVLSLIIYILELSLRFPVPGNDSPMLKLDGQPTYKNGVPDLNFEDWFDSNSIIENMNTAIQSVNVFQQRLGTIVDIDEETGPSIEEMDVDMYMSGSESDDIEEDVVWVHSDENLDDPQSTNSPFNRSPHPTLQPFSQPSLPSRAGMLALTEPVPTPGASSTSTALVPSISMDISPHSSVAEDNPRPDHPTSNSSSLCSFIYSSSNNESSSSSSSSSTSSSSTSSSSSSSSSAYSSNQNPVAVDPSSLNTAKTSESHPSSALLPRPNPKAHRRMIRFFNNLRRRSIDRRVQYNRTLDQMNQVTDMMRALPSSASPYVEVFPVNESIISLLLKLHSKLKGKSNSYVPSRTVSESRIGDGAHFIEIVLNLYCNSNVSSGLQSINEWKEKIWPSEPREESSTSNQEKEECSGSSQIDKDEKRRKAKERQQKLMAEFASKQKAFIKKMEAMKHSDEENLKESDIPPSGSYASSFLQAATYECIICGQSGSSTAEELVGMVVLLQPTNVWGHSIIRSMNEKVNDHRVLPCSQEEEISGQRVDNTLKCYMSKRIDDLVSVFDSPSWHFSMNIGWEGGVHVQSCGHFIHLECHKRYIQSLRDSQASNRFNVEGEFFCPLCRQLANSILPINPDIDSNGAVVKCRLNEPQELGIEIMNLLNNIGTSDKDLMQKFITFCEDLTKATPAHYRSPRISPSTDTLLSFFCSVLRTNLECELITILSQSNPTGVKKSCFISLFHVLALQARSLVLIKQLTPRFPCLWSQLTGIPIPEELSLSIAVREEEVPLLLQDTVSTLILLFSVLPLNVEKSYFSSVTQVLYNLTLIQGLAQITLFRPKDDYSSIPSSFTSLFGLLKYVHASFDNINCQTDRSTKLASLAQFFISHGYESELGQDKITEETSENLAKKLCLPFMRIAALLQSHLYNEPFPKNIVDEKSEEFVTLADFLGLQADGIPIWMIDDPSSLIGTWITDFSVLFPQNIIIARSLLQKRPVDIYRPSLLRLPSTYNHIFLYYHRKCCKTCNKIAREPCICLVCGTLVCFKDECCRYSSTGKYEAIAHADWCGAGTTIYLSVNSSCIIVIRGKRACYWGSVYLDSYGEEDNDLKRGKPLYLCKKRYAALEQQWLTHSFDHTNKRWILHKENL